MSRQRQISAGKQNTQLRHNARNPANQPNHHLQTATVKLFLFQRAVALRKQTHNFPLCPEGLDHRKTAQAVGQRGGEIAIPIRDASFRRLKSVAGQQGRDHGQHCQRRGDGRQKRRKPQHQRKRSEKLNRVGDHAQLLRQIIRLHARGVVCQRGKIGRRAFIPKGGNALFRQLLKREIPVLPYGLFYKARLERVIQQLKRHAQYHKSPGEPRERAQRHGVGRAACRVDQLLHKP